MKMVFALFAFVLLLCSFPLFAGEGFTGRFSDFSSAEKWRNSALSGDVPPVSFLLDGKPSSSLRWIKGKEEEARYTDFALSGEPAERLSRSADWVCPSAQLMLRVTESRYPGFPVAEYDARLVNLSDGPSKTVSDIRSLDSSVMKGGADAHYNRGTTIPCSAIEYEPFCVRVEKGKDLEVRTVTGLPTQDYLPFFNFAGKKGGVIAAVNWQGSWSMKASVSDGSLRLAAGQGETRLALLPREELRLPGTVLMFYKGSDWQEGQNLWRRWIVRHNLFRHTQKRFTELVYLASPLNQSLEADLAAIDSPFVKEIADRYFTVMEYDYAPPRGWFDCTRMNPGETGDWNPAPDFGGDKGLKEISERCRRQGVGLSFWIEPERCYEGTRTERDLGDEALIRDGRMCLADLGTKKAEDYFYRLSSQLIEDYGLNVYRQDHNTPSTEHFWAIKDAEEERRLGLPRRGAAEIHYCEGYVNYWMRLAKRFPGMLFDSCASGGRRNDLETLRFSFMHTYSDYWQYTLPSQCQKFGCNMWYIFSGGVLYNAFSRYEIRSRLSLSVGLDINPVGEKTLEVLEEWAYDHKYLAKDYYVLTDYDLSGENNMAVEFNDPENGRGMLIGYLRHGGSFVFKCRSLEADKRYLITDRDDPDFRLVMTGGDMMGRGVPVSRPRNQEAPCLEYSLTELPLSEVRYDAVSLFDTAPFAGVNDMERLCKGFKALPPGSLEFVSPDYDTSGGIYGISEDLFDILPFTGSRTEDGWIKLDPSRLLLEIKTVLPLTTWPEGGLFDVAAYARKYKGCCFLWLDNTYTFGDIDGGAKTENRRLGILHGGETVWSEPFMLHVSEWDRPETAERALSYICYDADRTGTIYRADKKVWDDLPVTQDGTEAMGAVWYPLDREKTDLVTDGNADGLTIYKGEKNGGYYLWIKNSRSIEIASTAKLYYLKGAVKERTVFWLVGSRFRSRLEPLPDLEKF